MMREVKRRWDRARSKIESRTRFWRSSRERERGIFVGDATTGEPSWLMMIILLVMRNPENENVPESKKRMIRDEIYDDESC